MKRTWGFALVVAAGVLLSGCGESSVGKACASTDECDNGQTCYTDVPGGYCSKGCTTEGTDEECPGGSVCATNSGKLLCSETCQTQADCRADYECNGVTGSSVKACRPKTK